MRPPQRHPDRAHRTIAKPAPVILAPARPPIWTLLSPHSEATRPKGSRGPGMKWKIAFSILALTIAAQASADERRGSDAALGALSGAVVLGPIGAVAGAVVGYTAGPSI